MEAMMKSFFVVMLLVSSIGAMADTFMCEMKVGQFLRKTEYAEHRGRNVTVTMNDYNCEGYIDNDIIVTTTLRSDITGESKNESKYGSSTTVMYTLDQWGDGQERLECTCSLN